MNKNLIQKILFALVAVAAFFGPMFDRPGALAYIVLIGSLYYLLFGWLFAIIKEEKAYVANEIVGFIFSTVFISNFLEQLSIPGARYITYYGYALSIALMIYCIVKRKEVNRGMLIQSIILFLIAPVPMFLNP